jgi:pimeloyl-ACP methyl ester carboxylesterase
MQRQRVLLPIDGHVVAADVHLLPDARPPVVFLHGALASLDVAADLFTAPDQESWVALSLPGHAPGRFGAGIVASHFDAALIGRLTEAAVATLVGDRQVVAVGWSLGGFAALNLAARCPRRVAAVASLAGFASGSRIDGLMKHTTRLAAGPLGRAPVEFGLRLAGRWPVLHRMCATAMTARRARLPMATCRRLHAAYRVHDPASLAVVLGAMRRLDISGLLDDIEAPTWIAAGDDDPVIPVTEACRLAARIPQATLTVYPGAGHLCFSEWPTLREDFSAWRRAVTGGVSHRGHA